MEDKKVLQDDQMEKVSGGGDRDGSFWGDKDELEPPIMDCCPDCFSDDITKTSFTFPYVYVCNSCGGKFLLPH